MTDMMMSLRALFRESRGADVLREMIGFAAERLKELEMALAPELSGARRARSSGAAQQLPAKRRGNPAGTVEFRIPRLGTDSSFPSFLAPRRVAEKALTTVIQEA